MQDTTPATDGSDFSRVYMVGHAHLDPVWLWRWTEGYQEARATLHAAIRLLEENPDYVFTFEQMAVVEWIRESEPELFERLKGLVAQGRIALVGGWWIEPDCNLPSLEAFVRHGLIGQRYLLQHFGGIASVGLNADPFGHAAGLPQILRGHRIDAYCFLRPGPHEIELADTAFDWVGIDGSTVFAYRIPHQYCSTGEDIDEHVDNSAAAIAASTGEEAMIFYGVGNHGGGPTRRNLASLARISASGRHGELVMSGPGRYFAAARATGAPRPVWHGELQRHAAGCYAAQSAMKRLNLRAEAALAEAERYATLATRLMGADYPGKALDHAWKTLLFNQFHDILPGSSIPVAYDDARNDLGGVMSEALRITNRVLQTVAREIDIPEDETTQPILVFNPHPHPVRFTAEIEAAFPPAPWALETEDGQPVAWQGLPPKVILKEVDTFRNRHRGRIGFVAEVPALGHRLYRLKGATQAPALTQPTARAEVMTLENEHLRLCIDPATGWLSELVTKDDGIDHAPLAGAAHTVVSPDHSDTWGHRVETYVAPGTPFTVESVTVESSGPVRAAIRVTSRHGASRLSELYILDAGARHVEIRTDLDWHEELHLLKLRYPTAIRVETALYQQQYGAIPRPADGKEYPGQRWVSVADDQGRRITVINDAKYAYDCTAGDIGITAARSPVYAWHDPRELRPDEHYEYQDQGRQSFTVCILPQTGDDMAEATRLAERLLIPPRVVMESFHPGTIPAMRGLLDGTETAPGIRLTALKPWEDDTAGTVLRFVNDTGERQRTTLTPGFLPGYRLDLDLKPYEIQTLLVAPDGTVTMVDLLEFPPDQPLPRLSDGV